MKIEFNNLGIIDHGELDIILNDINVKYGINGSGKSTIAKGLEKTIKGDDLSSLKKYDSDLLPTIRMDKPFSSVLVFNQEYVNQHLFHEDIMNNSFEIMINTEEYKLALKRINDLFLELVNSIKLSDIDNIKSELSEFMSIISFNTKETSKGIEYTVRGTSKFAKGKKMSDLSSLVSENVKPYQSLLEANNNFEWSKWFDNGVKLLNGSKCPFCLSDLPENFNEICAEIKSTFKTTSLKQNIEMKNTMNNIKKYVDEDNKKNIDNIINKNQTISSDDTMTLLSIYQLCEQELNKLNKLSDLSVIQIKEKYDNGQLIDFLEENKLLIDFYSHLDKQVFESIKKVNDSIDNLINKTKDINYVTKEFSKKLNLIISSNRQYINDFLKISGIPYEVDILALGDDNYKTVLKPINVEKTITKEDLSYGEMNAVSLILFALEASQNYDLIILDDPVSSFDNNKKFAIMYYLFIKEKAIFKNKTVILLTHDFNIIIDLLFKDNFKSIKKNCSFVSNSNGIFKEKRINSNKVKNTLRQWKKKYENPKLNILLRIVNLRKYLQYTYPSETNAFDILSSLEHLYDKPSKKSDDGLIDMDDSEILRGNQIIEEYINDFDYDKILSELKNNDNLRRWYNEATSSIDKLQIIRIFLNLNLLEVENQVFLSFITQSYHFENNEMMSLDEKKFNIVPNYIIKMCNSIINES